MLKLRDARALLLSAQPPQQQADGDAAGRDGPLRRLWRLFFGPGRAGEGAFLMHLLDWVAEEGGFVRVLDFAVGAELLLSVGVSRVETNRTRRRTGVRLDASARR